MSEERCIHIIKMIHGLAGTAADLCKCAMVHTQRQIANMGAGSSTPVALLLLQIHDELLWEVPDLNLSDVTGTFKTQNIFFISFY